MHDAPNRPLTPDRTPVDAAAARLTAMFGLRDCWFEGFPFAVQLPRIEPGRIVLPRREPGLAPWHLDLGIELPVHACGLTLGRFVLVPSSHTVGLALPLSQRAVAIEIAGDIAGWLEHQMRTEAQSGIDR